MLEGLGLEGGVEQFVNRAGYEAKGIEPLADALDAAHALNSALCLEIATSPETSMWRDHNIYNEMGIPALTYGPPGVAGTAPTRSQSRPAAIARVYALTALALCSGTT